MRTSFLLVLGYSPMEKAFMVPLVMPLSSHPDLLGLFEYQTVNNSIRSRSYRRHHLDERD